MEEKLNEAKYMRKILGISTFFVFTLFLSFVYLIVCILYSFKVRKTEWGVKAIDNNKNSWSWIVWFGGYFGMSLLVTILENSYDFLKNNEKNKQEKIDDIKSQLEKKLISKEEAKEQINRILGM